MKYHGHRGKAAEKKQRKKAERLLKRNIMQSEKLTVRNLSRVSINVSVMKYSRNEMEADHINIYEEKISLFSILEMTIF